MDNGSTGFTYPFGTSIRKFYFELSFFFGNVKMTGNQKVPVGESPIFWQGIPNVSVSR